MLVRILATGLVVTAFLAAAARIWAFPEDARRTKAACAACHANVAGGGALTPGGRAYLTSKKAPAPVAVSAEYAGSNRCRMCHPAEHQGWAKTPHAHAFTDLQAADTAVVAAWAHKLGVEVEGPAWTSASCVKCHVAGFELPGGYPAADSAKTAALAAVTCEVCHGPASRHLAAPLAEKKKFIQRAVTSKLCVQCHTPAITPKFDFEEMKKKGVHPIVAATPAK